MFDESLLSIDYQAVHSSLAIRRPAPGVAVIVLSGSDICHRPAYWSQGVIGI